MAILGEAPGDVDEHAFLDVVQDLLIAALISDEQKPQPVVLQNLKRFPRNVGLGVARPGDVELAQFARDGFGAGRIIGERVIVEEEFFDLRECGLAQRISSMTWPTLRVL